MTTRRPRESGRNGQQRIPQIIVPETASEFYVNAVLVAIGPWDFTVLCGTNEIPSNVDLSQMGGGQPVSAPIRIDAVLRMSPQHAKAVARTLAENVAIYESQFGEIRIPEREGERRENL